eukprot:1142540-Pelagomonas_calceolata.AAC.5
MAPQLPRNMWSASLSSASVAALTGHGAHGYALLPGSAQKVCIHGRRASKSGSDICAGYHSRRTGILSGGCVA